MQADNDPDDALVLASRRGDRDAFARIIERYQHVVYAVSFSNVRDHALSDDITQDTFVTAWRLLGEQRDITRLPAWLCGIARNHARDAYKRRRREQAIAPDELATSTTPFDALSDAESDRLVAAALDDVPLVYREPLVLFYYQQRSVEDVARTLEISVAATHQRLSRGRRYLADAMTVVVERGLARRGPKPELVACVLAAIGLLSASHVDASPLAKGSTMPMKSTVLTIAVLTFGTAGVMSADVVQKRATKPAKPSKPTATSSSRQKIARLAPHLRAVPQPVAPDCNAAGAHMSDLLETPKLAPHFIDKCVKQSWSENVRLCVVDADSYERAKIDCTDDPPATAPEVAALPAHLRCGVLARHVHSLATGPDGKFTRIKRKLADAPERVAQIDRMATALTGELEKECDQRPWSIDHRKCVAASTTHTSYGACRDVH